MNKADYSLLQLTLFEICEEPQGGQSQDSCLSKTCLDYFRQTRGWILEPCLKKSDRPKFQCLKVTDGQHAEWLNVKTVTLHGESLMLNTRECHNDVVESGLSQILENPSDVPQKYYLSGKATIGILRRASKRGKSLPNALKEALIEQSGLRGKKYGEQDIAHAGKILRDVWQEVGTENFIEWAQRTAVLVQQKEILFAEMFIESKSEEADEYSNNECKDEQKQGKKECSSNAMCRLWENRLHGSSSCRQESIKQLAGELGSVMQKLSCQKTPYEIFMCCLWVASEGASFMQKTLASMEEINFERMGHALYEENQENFRESNSIKQSSENSKFRTFDIRISSDGTQNWRAHCYETDKSRSLDTAAQNPDSNHGGVAILEEAPLVLESNQNHARVTQDGISPTLPASMGMGGGYVPMITEDLSTTGGQIYDMTHADDVIRQNEISPTLNARMGTGGNQVPIVTENIPKKSIIMSAGFKGGGRVRMHEAWVTR